MFQIRKMDLLCTINGDLTVIAGCIEELSLYDVSGPERDFLDQASSAVRKIGEAIRSIQKLKEQ